MEDLRSKWEIEILSIGRSAGWRKRDNNMLRTILWEKLSPNPKLNRLLMPIMNWRGSGEKPPANLKPLYEMLDPPFVEI